MRLSNLTDYAIVMLSAAARLGGTGAVSAAMLADETGVPLPTASGFMSGRYQMVAESGEQFEIRCCLNLLTEISSHRVVFGNCPRDSSCAVVTECQPDL